MQQREALAKTVQQQRDDLLKDVELAAEVQRLFLPAGNPAHTWGRNSRDDAPRTGRTRGLLRLFPHRRAYHPNRRCGRSWKGCSRQPS